MGMAVTALYQFDDETHWGLAYLYSTIDSNSLSLFDLYLDVVDVQTPGVAIPGLDTNWKLWRSSWSTKIWYFFSFLVDHTQIWRSPMNRINKIFFSNVNSFVFVHVNKWILASTPSNIYSSTVSSSQLSLDLFLPFCQFLCNSFIPLQAYVSALSYLHSLYFWHLPELKVKI